MTVAPELERTLAPSQPAVVPGWTIIAATGWSRGRFSLPTVMASDWVACPWPTLIVTSSLPLSSVVSMSVATRVSCPVDWPAGISAAVTVIPEGAPATWTWMGPSWPLRWMLSSTVARPPGSSFTGASAASTGWAGAAEGPEVPELLFAPGVNGVACGGELLTVADAGCSPPFISSTATNARMANKATPPTPQRIHIFLESDEGFGAAACPNGKPAD